MQYSSLCWISATIISQWHTNIDSVRHMMDKGAAIKTNIAKEQKREVEFLFLTCIVYVCLLEAAIASFRPVFNPQNYEWVVCFFFSILYESVVVMAVLNSILYMIFIFSLMTPRSCGFHLGSGIHRILKIL